MRVIYLFVELEIDPELKFNLKNKKLYPNINIKLNFLGKLWKRSVKSTC